MNNVLQIKMINRIKSLQSPTVIIPNQKSLSRKILKINIDGLSNLQVISDFDYTISNYGISTHEALELHPKYNLEVANKLRNLRAKNLKLLNMYECTNAVEQLVEAMHKWWTESHNLLVGSKITKCMIEESQQFSTLSIRTKFDDFIGILTKHNIPLTIFSAGLGDIITQVLKDANLQTHVIHIISNFFMFDENGYVTGFLKPTIHSHNKTINTVLNSKTNFDCNLSDISRQNILLMGDSLTDAHMCSGHAEICGKKSTILKIGWLNQYDPIMLKNYEAIFDVILLGEENFTIPCEIMKLITGKQ